jgi:AraC-like DNA-binding protein
MIKDIHYEIIQEPVTCFCKTKLLPHYFTFHSHNGYEILPLVNGNVSLFYESDSILMHPGDVILIPPYVFHRGYQNDDTPYIRDVLNIREDYTLPGREDDYDRLCHAFFTEDNQKINVVHPSAETFHEIHHLMLQISETLQKPADFENLLLRDTYVAQVLILLYKTVLHRPADYKLTNTWPENMPQFLVDTFRYINAHLTEPLSLDDIENAIHMNKYYLCRVFHEFTGGSIGQYIIEKRLALAKQKIQAGAAPSDACFQSGFNNYANFSRTFNRHVGVSPRTYQKAIRDGKWV